MKNVIDAKKMADGVDIDLYADDLEQDFAQVWFDYFIFNHILSSILFSFTLAYEKFV